jgi:hypothetical protein
MTVKVLHWHITVGLSILSLLFNFGWYLLVTHNATMSAKLAASSLITLGFAHGTHRAVAWYQSLPVAPVHEQWDDGWHPPQDGS